MAVRLGEAMLRWDGAVASVDLNPVIVFETGAGAVARNSIGVVLVGGMSIGTFFTLFIVPSVYVLLAKDHSKERVHLEKEKAFTPLESDFREIDGRVERPAVVATSSSG